MYRYFLSQDNWEYYSEIEILHNEEYSKEEFLDICKKAYSKLNIKDKKNICETRGDTGMHLIKDILINEFGFVFPDKIINNIHMSNLVINYVDCNECSKSFMLNDKFICSDNKCEFKEFFENNI